MGNVKLLPAAFFLVLSLCGFLIAQQHPPPSVTGNGKLASTVTAQEIAESGTFDGSVYRNKSLGFSLSIPKTWSLISDDMNKAGLETGRKLITEGQSADKEQALNASIARTRVLFQAYPSTSPLGTTGLLACGVERTPDGITQDQYAAENLRLLQESSLKAQLTKSIYKTNVGGKSFSAFDVQIVRGDMTMDQTYYIHMRRGVAFFFVLTRYDRSYEKQLADVLTRLSFED